ncbi:MAG: DUF6484 domain-containing protein [Myxococcota bacterium]
MSERKRTRETGADGELLELLSKEPIRSATALAGIAIGSVEQLSGDGVPYVSYPGAPRRDAVPARTLVSVDPEDLGRACVLGFEGGDPARPILIGLLRDSPRTDQLAEGALTVRVDGNRVFIEAEHEVVIRCGDSSIELNRDGKVRIRGKDIETRSSGRHRIKGGSVQIN